MGEKLAITREAAMEQALTAIKKISGGIQMNDATAHECLATIGSLASTALYIGEIEGYDRLFIETMVRLTAPLA